VPKNNDLAEYTQDKIIGVIGGLGPEATADFFSRVIRNTPAKTDQDHLHILIDNNPKAPNRHDAISGTGPSPAEMFAQSACRLETAGAEFLVMPCNTAHAFEKAITEAIQIPLVSIITETCNFIQAKHAGIQRVGLLAADGCLQAKLYDLGLDRVDVAPVCLSNERQKDFMALVHRIKATGVDDIIKTSMKQMANELIDHGAQAILAGCTEVPLVLGQNDLSVPLIDSTEILARRCVQIAKNQTE
jgi:aspartate racemase